MSGEVEEVKELVIEMEDETRIILIYDEYIHSCLIGAMDRRGLGDTITLTGENWPVAIQVPLDKISFIIANGMLHGYD